VLKVIVNINRSDVVYARSLGQRLPDLEGKLISVEANGKELLALHERHPVPLNAVDTVSVTWHGRHAARALKTFRQIFDEST